MVNRPHGRRITAILWLKGNRRVVLRMAGTVLVGVLFTVGGAGLLWLGYHPDGSGRPPAWNVFAGYCGLIVGVPSFLIMSLFTIQERGLVPSLLAVRTRDGYRLGSPGNFFTLRPLAVRDGESGVGLRFGRTPLEVTGTASFLAYPYWLEVKGRGKRGYVARSPIATASRSEAQAALRKLGLLATSGEQ